jgi:hypothetical protein
VITGIWMNEEHGANQLLVAFDDGDGGAYLVDFTTTPPSIIDGDGHSLDGWVEMQPGEDL